MADGVPQGIDGAGSGFTQQRLEFGEELFDGIEAGTVRRQIAQDGAGRFNGVRHTGDFVGGEIVQHDNVARPQHRHQALLHPGQEGRAVDGTVEDRRRRDAVMAQGGEEGGGLPVTVGNITDQALALQGTSVTRRHIGRDPGLVDEHQAGGLKMLLRGLPGGPRHLHVATLLFGGDQGFFYR